MKIIVLFFSCLSFFNFAYTQGNSEDQYRIGDKNVTITWELDHDIFVDQFNISHKNLVTGEERPLAEITLYGSSNVTTSPEDGYNIIVTNTSATEKAVELVIEEIRFEDDGQINFFAENTNNTTHHFSMSQNITVLKPATNLVLTVIPLAPVDLNSQSDRVYTIGVNETHAICVSEGSNPTTSNFTLTFNGEDVTDLTIEEAVLTSTTERIYDRSAVAVINITEADGKRQDVECMYIDPVGNSHSTKIYFKTDVSGSECLGPLTNLVLVLAMTVLWSLM